MADDDAHVLVARLVQIRKRAGISLADVAHYMGTSTMTVRRLEGAPAPALPAIERYAAAIGVNLTWEIEELRSGLDSAEPEPGDTVDIAWGLEEPVRATVRSVHGSPGRIWYQVELEDETVLDVPAGALEVVRKKPRRRR